MKVPFDPPAIVQPSRMQEEIAEFKAMQARYKSSTEARDAAMKDMGRWLIQKRDTVPIGWGEFCTKELGISKAWAKQLIQYAKGTRDPESDRARAKEKYQDLKTARYTSDGGLDEEDIAVAKIKRDGAFNLDWFESMLLDILGKVRKLPKADVIAALKRVLATLEKTK